MTKLNNLIPTEMSKNESDKVFDSLIYQNHFTLNKKLNVFLGDHHRNFICRRYKNSYTNENILINHKENSGNDSMFTIRTSSESHL